MRSTSSLSARVFTKTILVLALVLALTPPLPANAQTGVNSVPEAGGTAGGAIGSEQRFVNASNNRGSLSDAPDDFGCSLSTTFTNCLAAMMYWIGPGLASNVAYIGAYFFSTVIQLSLNSTAYALTFLSEGWQVVRDLANMAFIFILIYIALTVMLQAETAGTIKTLAVVVVVALLVNFSFFFTRVMIDAGNILALQFYNAIPGGTIVSPDGSTQLSTINGTKDLSASIMEAVQLQTLYGSKAFQQARTACGGDSATCGLVVSSVIYLSVAAMFWMLFFAFLQVGIKFLLRIVGLWFLLIASPLAFVAKTMKKTEGYFSQWWKMLFQFSVYPAIFLFMFLILTKFTTAVLANPAGGSSLLYGAFNAAGSTSDQGIMAAIAVVAIRMGFVLALMYIALRVSDWIVKEGGVIASTATGWTLGKGFGGAAALSRGTLGWGAQRLHETAGLRDLAAKGGILGRTLWRGAGAIGRSSLDLRNAPGLHAGAKRLGDVDVGQSTNKGGFAQRDAERIAWREKEAKALKPSEGQLFKAMSGVVKEMKPEERKRLMNAATHYANTKEAQKNGEASSEKVAAAKKNYTEALKSLGVKQKIDDVKAAVGSSNAKAYAGAITTTNWRNLWGATSGIPFWIGKADHEAAAKIRGSGSDVEQMKNLLSVMGVKADDDYEPPTGDGNGPTAPKGGGRGGPRSGGDNDNNPNNDGGGGGGTPGGAAGSTSATTPPATNAVARAGGTRAFGGFQPVSGPIVAQLSAEDRALFKKAIRAIKNSGETTEHGLADVANRISSSSHKEASNNSAAVPKAAANDNTPLSRLASNDNEPFTIDLDGEGKAA